jgi:hypothetical protein
LIRILLGSIGYVAVGTLLSSMAVQTAHATSAAHFTFPVIIPHSSAVKASSGAGAPMDEITPG